MQIIAHRGLIDGPNKDQENRPETIQLAIESGFDVEVDLSLVNGEWFLGHDIPQYLVDTSWIISISQRSWFHCKNAEALLWLVNNPIGVTFFWHDSDHYTLTSNGYVWAYPGSKVEGNSILVLPERVMSIHEIKNVDCYGVCTDFAAQAREILK